MRGTFTALTSLLCLPVCGAPCLSQSGPQTTALVELYTSAECPRCPRADRWLSALAAGGQVRQKVVPLALHVDYRDYVGSSAPYARRDFSLRQRRLTPLQRLALVYTPQVMLQGRQVRQWDTPAFDAAVAQINATPARARLWLEIASARSTALIVRAGAELLDPGQVGESGLYLAAFEHRLDKHLVLQWEGPTPFARARLELERALPLVPGARNEDSGVVAFVQNRRSAEVLQVLLLATCP